MSAATLTDTAETTGGLSGTTRLLLAIFAILAAVIIAAVAIGPVVLTLTALVLVPIMFILFVAISRP